MCGIAGIHFKDTSWLEDQHRPVLERFADNLALGIEHRGTDATGFLAIEEGGSLQLDKKALEASSFIKTRKPLPPKTRTLLIHTRFATQGPVENYNNNHPVNYNATFVTHNGTIRNDDRLFKSEDLERKAEVDSEIIAALLDKYGLDEFKKALEPLSGGFAIAAVNAMEPGRLLLAKGGSWPLCYHENKQFIMWASEKDTMDKAWKQLLKNPTDIQYNYLAEGDAIAVNGGLVEVLPKAFSTGYTYSSPRTASQWNWWEDEDDDWDKYGDADTCGAYGNYSSRSTYTTSRRSIVEDRSKTVEVLREAGKGRALIWKKELTPEERRRTNNRWRECPSCRELISDVDFTNSLVWGDICVDCRDVAAAGGRKLATKAQITKDDIEDLEKWARLDFDITWKTIMKVAGQVGITAKAVNYLLFLVNDDYLKNNPEYGELAAELRDLYQDAEAEVWDEYIDELDDDNGDEKNKKSRIVHVNGETHDLGADCEKCTPGEKKEAGVQAIAKTATVKGCGCPQGCYKCKGKDKNGKNKCMTGKCRKKAKVYRAGLFQWCDGHASKCSEGRCKEAPVATVPDGKRYCHKHIRGKKGSLFDNDRNGLNRAFKEHRLSV